jgi:DNA-binding Lrp family transcriptional regulator
MTQTELSAEVLRLLQANGRMSAAEMADRLMTSQARISEAIADLEGTGVLIGYAALVNDEKLPSPPVRAIIEVEVQPERDGGFDRVARMISRFPEVKSVYLVSGHYDLRLEVVGETMQAIGSFVASKLAPMSGVRATATHFLLKKYKETGFVLEETEEYERLKITP